MCSMPSEAMLVDLHAKTLTGVQYSMKTAEKLLTPSGTTLVLDA